MKRMLCNTFHVYKKKYIEIELTSYDFSKTITFFDLQFQITRKMDHAGITLQLALFNVYFMLVLYDSRHWDNETNTWET